MIYHLSPTGPDRRSYDLKVNWKPYERCGIMNATKRFANGVFVVTLVLGFGLLSSCVDTLKSKKDQAGLDRVEPTAGTLCERRLYELPSDDPRCYALQKKLHNGSINGNLTAMKEALSDGANVEGKYYDSSPPLIAAARSGQTEAVMLLVHNGADVNQVLTFGNTPLKSAVYSKSEATVKFLIEQGANICENTPDEDTALEIARKNGSKEIFEILKQDGAETCK